MPLLLLLAFSSILASPLVESAELLQGMKYGKYLFPPLRTQTTFMHWHTFISKGKKTMFKQCAVFLYLMLHLLDYVCFLMPVSLPWLLFLWEQRSPQFFTAFPRHFAQCLVHRRCLTDISWKNRWGQGFRLCFQLYFSCPEHSLARSKFLNTIYWMNGVFVWEWHGLLVNNRVTDNT